MTSHILTAPREAESLIARIFCRDRRCTVRVREDKAFQGAEWLDLGSLTLDSGAATTDQLIGAVRRGAFEWAVPQFDQVRDALTNLYDKVSVGGYVIVDDYGEDAWTYCRKAVDEFRQERGITDELVKVDKPCSFWRKTKR